MPTLRPVLTVDERAARQRLIVRDSLALLSLLLIAITLTFITYALFHSFADHRVKLEQRWKARGEAALAGGQPQRAIESLRSALAYAPDDRGLQIELATALAAAGHTREAIVYFDTLHEAEPGNGMINEQLARLSASQGNVPLAVMQYQAALDGTWNGDGFVRRREVRLELSRYLIAQHRFDEAKNELLIAAGNAADNHQLQLTVGGLLEQAEGESDAYTIYRKAIAFSDTRTAALAGAGRTSAAQGRYLVARNLLAQAETQPDFNRLPQQERALTHALLGTATAILDAFPAENLPVRARAIRVARLAQVARTRLEACTAAPTVSPGSAAHGVTPLVKQMPGQAPPASGARSATSNTSAAAPSPLSAPAAAQAEGALRSAITAVQRAGDTLGGPSPAPAVNADSPAELQASAAAQLAALSARWQQLPDGVQLERRMERDPVLLANTLQLVYDTVRAESPYAGDSRTESAPAEPGSCPALDRDDLLLQRIAAAPDQVEQQ